MLGYGKVIQFLGFRSDMRERSPLLGLDRMVEQAETAPKPMFVGAFKQIN